MGMAAPTVDEFFDTEFLTALQGFSLWARRIISGGRHAEQLSKDKGAGLEFADYKAYVPGDDTRTIDWNIYRRLGRVVVKVFEERQELPVYLLVDRSSSMYFEAAPKIGVALKVALALASISLSQHDRRGTVFVLGQPGNEAQERFRTRPPDAGRGTPGGARRAGRNGNWSRRSKAWNGCACGGGCWSSFPTSTTRPGWTPCWGRCARPGTACCWCS